jgi:curved DNA-binding protein CbpA
MVDGEKERKYPMNAYFILGVKEDATNEQIRKAYLDMVRTYPPERDPERFRHINGAFESIKNEKARASYFVLKSKTEITSPFNAFLTAFKYETERKCMPLVQMKEFIRSCIQK